MLWQNKGCDLSVGAVFQVSDTLCMHTVFLDLCSALGLAMLEADQDSFCSIPEKVSVNEYSLTEMQICDRITISAESCCLKGWDVNPKSDYLA